uniref:Peptidase_M1_N domain-containing protein n=1 Tax=Macrostomum lignano TaxID=282301 RepID=A0A1I8FIU8_9PLAT
RLKSASTNPRRPSSCHSTRPCQSVGGQLSLSFSGALNSRMKGFYRTVYTDSSTGAERSLRRHPVRAPTDARRCLPCWDEPGAEGNLRCHYATDRDTSSGLVSVKFQQSPIMSTYLLAFAVGRFDYVEDYDSDNVRLRVYTPAGRAGSRADFRAGPGSCRCAGTSRSWPWENWGLVTYQETALLVDCENSSAANKRKGRLGDPHAARMAAARRHFATASAATWTGTSTQMPRRSSFGKRSRGEASGQPMGYPLISVSAKPADNDDGQQLELSISRSESDSSLARTQGLAAWRVPIQPRVFKMNLLLTEKSAAVRVPKAAWVKLNPGFVGVYRTFVQRGDADGSHCCAAAGTANADRFNLESDLFRAVFRPVDCRSFSCCKVVDACKVEQFYTVWADLLDNLAATIQLCEPAFQRCGGWDALNGRTGHDVALLRGGADSRAWPGRDTVSGGGEGPAPGLPGTALREMRHTCRPAGDSIYRTVLSNGCE